jgi:biotin carboxyl carrier protein
MVHAKPETRLSMKNFKFKVDNRSYEVDIVEVGEKRATVNVNGIVYEVEVDKKLKPGKQISPRQDYVPSTDNAPATKAEKTENGKTIIRSPLPGKIIGVLVKEGEKVSIGQTIICIEAMKMENNIRCDKEGVVKFINVKVEETVMDGHPLLEIE